VALLVRASRDLDDIHCEEVSADHKRVLGCHPLPLQRSGGDDMQLDHAANAAVVGVVPCGNDAILFAPDQASIEGEREKASLWRK